MSRPSFGEKKSEMTTREMTKEVPVFHYSLLRQLDFLAYSYTFGRNTNKNSIDSLATVSQLPELLHSHGFFLDVVLSKQSRLPCDHLLNWCWDKQIINIIIALSRLPLLRRNHLKTKQNITRNYSKLNITSFIFQNTI